MKLELQRRFAGQIKGEDEAGGRANPPCGPAHPALGLQCGRGALQPDTNLWLRGALRKTSGLGVCPLVIRRREAHKRDRDVGMENFFNRYRRFASVTPNISATLV